MPHEITVDAPPDRAFALFTEGMTEWWPPEYTWAQKTLDHIAIEPRRGRPLLRARAARVHAATGAGW